jgi:YebC/PmpR family DNA-binding regulatory protein
MSGHSHWSGIKHKKEITDKKRAKIFSKSLKLISAAAHSEPNPAFNPRLRTAVAKAREAGVPADTIDRAIKRAADPTEKLEELLYEAYGPGAAAILITAISDNRNRTVQEIKTILRDHNGKWAESGSVQWAFELRSGDSASGAVAENAWIAKFPQDIADEEDKQKLADLLDILEENDDVQNVYTNINF